MWLLALNSPSRISKDHQVLSKTGTQEQKIPSRLRSQQPNSSFFVEALGYFKVNQTKEVTVKSPRD